jgi:hypothetical protein
VFAYPPDRRDGNYATVILRTNTSVPQTAGPAVGRDELVIALRFACELLSVRSIATATEHY